MLNKRRVIYALVALLITVGVLPMVAGGCRNAPFQFSVTPKVQIVPEGDSVDGIRLCIPYGSNMDVRGLDLGLCCGTANSTGLQVGGFAVAVESVTGIQIGVLAVCPLGGVKGLQVGALAGGEYVQGVTVGAFVKARDVEGLQAGALAVGDETVTGVQLGLVANLSGKAKVKGAQVGLVNVANELSGVQFGLININKRGWLPFFPLVNIGFGGNGAEPPENGPKAPPAE